MDQKESDKPHQRLRKRRLLSREDRPDLTSCQFGAYIRSRNSRRHLPRSVIFLHFQESAENENDEGVVEKVRRLHVRSQQAQWFLQRLLGTISVLTFIISIKWLALLTY